MTVLYRTYRPQKWSEVIGQDPIVEALRDAVAADRVAHAYLFSGSRGTGKTTVARILARELGASGEDTYEIDAASNRGIDDIRELREHVAVLPFVSSRKVYIIDEVHMLSKDAWNALLKTLEEPPQHVVFVLATTELDKVPETIVSRCQTFAFRKPAREVIRKQVAAVAKKEGYDLDAGAADLIAILGDGSFRDALSMLEKVVAASSAKKIGRSEAEAITGAPRAELVNRLIESLLAKDCDAALRAVADAEGSSVSMATFMTLILEKLRFILLASRSRSSEASIRERVSPDDWAFISAQAAKGNLTPETLAVVLQAAEESGRSHIEHLPLELAIAKICGVV